MLRRYVNVGCVVFREVAFKYKGKIKFVSFPGIIAIGLQIESHQSAIALNRSSTFSRPGQQTMVTFYDEIVPELHDFITTQAVFFTGTAPLHIPRSHVNVSPKGYAESTFTVVNPRCVWYQDATGSGMYPKYLNLCIGIETISHIYDNGRITIMFCSFGPEPKIVRLYGRGTVYEVLFAILRC